MLAEIDEVPSQTPEIVVSGNGDERSTKTPQHKKLCRVAAQVNHHRRLSADIHSGNNDYQFLLTHRPAKTSSFYCLNRIIVLTNFIEF